MILLWALVLVVSSVALWWLLTHGGGDAYSEVEDGRPETLRGASVILVKRRLSIRTPFALHGEPDVVYLTERGTIIVREDKTGFEQPAHDRIQVSVYGALLRHSRLPELAGRTVEPIGIIRYGIPGKTRVRWKEVPLLDDGQLSRLVSRYRAIVGGAAPSVTEDPGACRARCGHLGTRCQGSEGKGGHAQKIGPESPLKATGFRAWRRATPP